MPSGDIKLPGKPIKLDDKKLPGLKPMDDVEVPQSIIIDIPHRPSRPPRIESFNYEEIALKTINVKEINLGFEGVGGTLFLQNTDNITTIELRGDKGYLLLMGADKQLTGYMVADRGIISAKYLRTYNDKNEITFSVGPTGYIHTKSGIVTEGGNIWVMKNKDESSIRLYTDGRIFARGDITTEEGNLIAGSNGKTGNLKVNGNGSMSGDLSINGKISTEGGLEVKGSSSMSGNLSIDGRMSTKGGLEVYGNSSMSGNLTVAGDILLTDGGADCAEEFDIAELESPVQPGTVMVIDNDGVLRPSEQAYDKRVAGVISGAGDYRPGITLDRQKDRANRLPIALTGKIYCKVDAEYSSIEVGDLLTTSLTPGHAMRADDPAKAFGAVIGKALRPIKTGRGLIPILVALQ